MAEELKVEKSAPKINVRFIHNWTNDLGATRKLYTDLIGMQEVSFKDEEQWGWVAYQCEGLQYMFMRLDVENKKAEITEFAFHPGHSGGTIATASFGIEIPEADFCELVEKLQQSEYKLETKIPEWRQDCYWGISVLDPAGNTVELYTTPKDRPEKTEWE